MKCVVFFFTTVRYVIQINKGTDKNGFGEHFTKPIDINLSKIMT